jgi:hypothetical protein
VLGASTTIEATRPRRSGQNVEASDKAGDGLLVRMKQKITDLEEEVKTLKSENEKQVSRVAACMYVGGCPLIHRLERQHPEV